MRAGGDDLRRAAMVGRKSDHLHTSQAIGETGQEGGIRPVEAVDGLRWITDEVEIVAAAGDELEEPVLDRVEVLRFVDEQMAITPADRVAPRCVGLQIAHRHDQQVVEIDDASTPLQRLEGGERPGDAFGRCGAAA